MKVSQIMLSPRWTAAERHVIELCHELQRHDIEVQLICRPQFAQQRQSQLAGIAEVISVNAFGNWNFWSVWEIRDHLRRFSPHLVHTHLARAALMGGAAAARLKLPRVCTPHNRLKAKYLGALSHFIATTAAQRRHLNSLGVSDREIREIPNFSRADLNQHTIRTTAPLFVASGRFVPKKGFDVLLTAFAQLLTSLPEARLLLAGAGSEEKALRQRLGELSLQHQVEILPSAENLQAFLQQGAVFVLPSREDPFALVLLEAMANGIPIVCTTTAGPLELLDEQSAWFARIGDAESLARNMLECWRAPQQRAEKARRAQLRYAQHYHVAQVMPAILDYYRELAAGA